MKKQRGLAAGCLCLLALFFVSVTGYAQRAAITFVSPNVQASGFFGWSVSAAGDVNNDGFADILIGAYQENPGGSPQFAGRAYVFSGPDSSLLRTFSSPNEEMNGSFGYSVSAAGDLNQDGFGDVVIGAYLEDGGAVDAGRAYVFSGADGALLFTLTSPAAEVSGNFGWDVSGAVDVNNDGTPDILVTALNEDGGAMDAGRVYAFSGSDGSLLLTLNSPNAEIAGNFGRSLSGIADVNADGNDDIIVGAFFEDGGATKSGRAYVFSGADGSLLHALTSPNAEINGFFGWSVSRAGDVNNNGTEDIVVSAFLEDGGATDAGRVYVFNGANGGLLYSFTSLIAQANGFFGWSVSGAGDINNDGFADIIAGAISENGGASRAGRAYIFSGADGSALHILTSRNPESFGQFGWSVSATGDIDNDGRDDVVVGAPFENGGASDAGRAYAFVHRPPVPQGLFLLAEEEIIFKHHTFSEGIMHSNGAIVFQSGSPSIHSGDMLAVGNIKIAIDNTIEGDVTAAGIVINKGTVTGTVTSNAAVDIEPLPGLPSFSPGSENIKTKHNSTFTLAPGAYGKVEAGNNAILYLSSGEYNLKRLIMGTASLLSIDVSAGPVTINLVEDFFVKPEMKMEIIGDNSGFPSTQVTINSAYTDEMKIRRHSVFLATLNAPFAHVIIQEEAFFKGAIAAREIEIQHRVTAVFHASPLSPAAAMPPLTKAGNEAGPEADLLPSDYELSQNYPNPFNPTTTIRFALPEAGSVRLMIYNIQGQLVRTLGSGYYDAGYHQFQWDATSDAGEKVASGYYFYRLVSGDFQQAKKMLLLK